MFYICSQGFGYVGNAVAIPCYNSKIVSRQEHYFSFLFVCLSVFVLLILDTPTSIKTVVALWLLSLDLKTGAIWTKCCCRWACYVPQDICVRCTRQLAVQTRSGRKAEDQPWLSLWLSKGFWWKFGIAQETMRTWKLKELTGVGMFGRI